MILFGRRGRSYLICFVINHAVVGVDSRTLLWRCRGSIGCCLLSLHLCLRNDVRLVNSSLDDLLLFRIEVLCEIFVEGRLFLLKTCWSLVGVEFVDWRRTYEAMHA
jgi:hypothetical protein